LAGLALSLQACGSGTTPEEPSATNGSCGTTGGACAVGTATGDNNLTACGTTRAWTCNGLDGGTAASCSLANKACGVSNGACSKTLGECAEGWPSDDNGLAACGTTRTWKCNGEGGGTNASCSSANAACPAIAGVCSKTAGACATGTVADDTNTTACGKTRTWTCKGTNGGAAASCSLTNDACPYTVTTIAGSSDGYLDGTGTAARFSMPTGVAVDTAGNLYVIDAFNQRIRAVTAAGVVTTLAGGATAGSADGTGNAAQFSYPSGIAIGSDATLYVADQGNNLVRKATAAGVVTTLAGSGDFGSLDGTGTAAQFNTPYSVAVDTNGNVYVADKSNTRIRKVTSAGVVTTLAGGSKGFADGTGGAAQFNQPQGVAVDAHGVVYVADTQNNRIRKVTAAGEVTTLAGSGKAGWADDAGTAAVLNQPDGLTVDAQGNVFVADTSNDRIRKVTAAGVVTTLAGNGGGGGNGDGAGTAASFNKPQGIAVDSQGNLYVADTGSNRIRKLTPPASP
jgi:sugar lactone lactonase YvrE